MNYIHLGIIHYFGLQARLDVIHPLATPSSPPNLIGVRATLISNQRVGEGKGGFLMVEYHKSSAPLTLSHPLIDQINVALTPIKSSLDEPLGQ